MTSTETLAAIYERDAGDRWESLETARQCARLIDPGILPHEGHVKGQPLHENFQSLGALGFNNLEGKMLAALWPPMLPWFKLEPAGKIKYAPDVTPEYLEALHHGLFLRELLYQSLLESAESGEDYRGRQTGFRASKRRAISQLLITGDVLERLDANYQLHVYRRDQYVTRRDSAGNVLYHVVKEMLDPLSLTEPEREKANLKTEDLRKKPVTDRQMPVLTRTEWQPLTRKWVVTQQVNDQTILEFDERVSQFFCTPYKLTVGEDYGRGRGEQLRGDLKTFDYLCGRAVDWAGLASKMTPVLDPNSYLKPADLAKKSGEPVIDDVEGGRPKHIAFLSVEKVPDFGVMKSVMDTIQDRLARALLIGSEAVRDSERTTKAEYLGLVRELDGELGGVYAPISDYQQLPLIRRVEHQAQTDKLVAPLPRGAVEIHVLTGIAALARSAKVSGLNNIAAAAQALGPEALAKIDVSALIDALARYENIHEPAVVKSDERVAAEREQMKKDAAQALIMEQGVKTMGAVAENNLQPPAPGSQPPTQG